MDGWLECEVVEHGRVVVEVRLGNEEGELGNVEVGCEDVEVEG